MRILTLAAFTAALLAGTAGAYAQNAPAANGDAAQGNSSQSNAAQNNGNESSNAAQSASGAQNNSAQSSNAAAAANAGSGVLTGEAAYGSWENNEPGTERLILPSDLPAPYATESASNAPAIVARPQDAMPVVPQGFSVSEFASGLQMPRVIAIAPNGDIFVADSGAGEIHVYHMNQDGSSADDTVFASGLDMPYGIAFYPSGDNPQYVYVANTGSVVRFPYHSGDMQATGDPETIVPSLKTGYHWTRDIVFSPDDKTMYVSVGSGSNVAEDMDTTPPEGFVDQNPVGATWGPEQDRANVLSFNPDGSNMQIYADGIRNCSGMTLQPATNDLWCVTNERDGLGDNLPPDYATHVQMGAFYGWPWYYIGSNEDPRHAGERPDLAGQVTVPDVLFQPHSAPLGIDFYEDQGNGAFPQDYDGDAFVAMHGSWNRDHRTGYKVVRLEFDDNGKPTGVYQDFMTGFVLDDQNVWGRPVDVTEAPDGSLLVSDDGSGTIWRIAATGQANAGGNADNGATSGSSGNANGASAAGNAGGQ